MNDKNIQDAVDLTKYFYSLPRLQWILIAIFGVFFAFAGGLSLNGHTISTAFLTAFTVLLVPSLVMVILGKIIFPPVSVKKISFVVLLTEIILALFYFFGVVSISLGFGTGETFVIIGSISIFLIAYLITRIVFGYKWRSILFAFAEVLFFGAFLFMQTSIPILSDNLLLKFSVSLGVVLVALYLFLAFINAPTKRLFGVGSTEAASLFFAHWFFNKKDMEALFKKIGQTVETYIHIYLFKPKREAGKPVLFVIPYLHYGPFGKIGGSAFTERIFSHYKKEYLPFVFHGTATHDMNPVSSKEISKIYSVVDGFLGSAKPRRSKIIFFRNKSKTATADILQFDNCSFASFSRAPETTEDISLGSGLYLTALLDSKVGVGAVVDQHNSETGRLEYIEPGKPELFEYAELITKGKEEDAEKLIAGFSHRDYKLAEVGGAGVSAALFMSKKPYILYLIDANGITPKFKERLVRSVEKYAKKELGVELTAEIYTTDTHAVNKTRGVINPLHSDRGLSNILKELLKETYENRMEYMVAYERKKISLKVLGPKQAMNIITTVNSIVAVAKIAAPLLLLSAVILSILIIRYL